MEKLTGFQILTIRTDNDLAIQMLLKRIKELIADNDELYLKEVTLSNEIVIDFDNLKY